MEEKANPLSKYYRQPAIYIKFPSGGKYYTEDIVTPTENGEHAVLPMTAKDDLAFKTPDSLMSGQSTVDVIKSCVPDIKDPWRLVNYDVDTILIAIRIAGYGETMDVQTSVPKINEPVSHTVNLPSMLEEINRTAITESTSLPNGMKIQVKPLTYKMMTETQLKTFEQQRKYMQVNSANISDDEKTKMFNESFKTLTDLNSQLLLSNIETITLPSGDTVSDSAQIKEFIENAESKLVQELESALVRIRQQGSLKPMTAKSTEEQIKKGAPATYQVPITFDNANFFG
tara:strand:+ start:594 stop:1451 length:858 start_codon:yes stop_codon:yes gene_type:complete